MQIPVFIDSVIYTQQKLLSHIDTLIFSLLPNISTHSRNYLVIQTTRQSTERRQHLHIVEITQSYRHHYCQVPSHHLHIVEITQSYRQGPENAHPTAIYTQQKLLSHIDFSLLAAPFVSTHSRNYLVIQTASFVANLEAIYTQQKLLSHIDSYCANIHIFY